jgi:hypothetical protein
MCGCGFTKAGPTYYPRGHFQGMHCWVAERTFETSPLKYSLAAVRAVIQAYNSDTTTRWGTEKLTCQIVDDFRDQLSGLDSVLAKENLVAEGAEPGKQGRGCALRARAKQSSLVGAGGGGGQPNCGELSKSVGGLFGRLTLCNTATTKSYWIATTQKYLTSKRSGKERRRCMKIGMGGHPQPPELGEREGDKLFPSL